MDNIYTLPSGWEWKNWDDIVTIKNGKDYKAVLNENGKYPIYGSGGIMNYSDEYLCNENSVVIGRKGTINSPLFVTEKFWNIDTAFGIEAKEELLKARFLYYFCLSYNFLQLNTSTTLPSLTKSNLLTIKMPLPPLDEQKRLVSLLDTLFAKIDRSIELLIKNIAAAGALLPSALNTVFGEFGEKYTFETLDQIATNHDNQREPIKESDRSTMQGEYPYYGASGVIDHVNEYIYDGEYLLISEDGANLVIRKYPIAFIAKGKFWVNNHAHVVKAIETKTTNEFLEYSFAYLDISSYITGAAQPKLSQKKLYEIQIVVPPLDIQTQTVAYLDSIRDKVEVLKHIQNDKISNLKALKASILDRAFKGEL